MFADAHAYHREGGPLFAQFKTTDGAGCGLDITHMRASTGDFLVGTLDGKLHNINVDSATKDVHASFRVPRK